jgi:hypothetical protein
MRGAIPLLLLLYCLQEFIHLAKNTCQLLLLLLMRLLSEATA